MTVAATIATAPLIALHFGRVSLVGLPANVLAAPAVAPAMWLGALAAAIGQVERGARVPVRGTRGAADGVPRVARARCGASAGSEHAAAAGRRGRAVRGGRGLDRPASPRPAAVVAARRAGARAARARAARRRRGGRHRPVAPGAAPALRISFLDVGQGDATLIQAGGRAVLVDAGPVGDHVASLVRHEGARRLDLLVITHAQADHEGGAADVLSQLPVTAILDGRDGVGSPDGTRLEAAAHARRVRLLRPSAGQILRAGPIRLDVLSPPRDGRIPGGDPNARAIVLEARAAGVRILLTADAESDVLSSLPLAPVDLLKVSHHGSADPGLPALLGILRPRAAVIEVGRHNPYGHPAPATVRALTTGAGRVLRTDHDGTIRFELRAGRLVLATHG